MILISKRSFFCSFTIALLALSACSQESPSATGVERDTQVEPDTLVDVAEQAPTRQTAVSITSDVPHDVPGGQRLPASDVSNQVLAQFAWQQFLALTWQSDYNPANHSRGAPDTAWNHSKPYTAGQPLVWETYAHRSELRPFGVPLNTPFSKAPTYLFGVDPAAANASDSFALFNNLDEDSEIGSANIYLGDGDPSSQDLILYQAKVNQSEYDYIKDNFGATQFEQFTDAPTNSVPSALQAAQTANQNSIKNNLQPAANGINLPAGDNNVAGTVGEGAIEIKTAFIRITNTNQAQFTNFFKTSAIYYTADIDQTTGEYSNFKYHNGTFALLGIHIIHKTKSYPDFIFTSFEHKDLKNMDFQYILTSPLPPEYAGADFNPHNVPTPPPNTPAGTQIGNRVAVQREQQNAAPASASSVLYPIPSVIQNMNTAVHQQLQAVNPNSIWLNYILMGVQANITESWADSASGTAGPNHFMANHVIESDAFLGHFFGPGFGSNPFSNDDNILYQGATSSMGGCKGCHGVAQTSFGTDFSFLLDFGVNKPVVQPDTIIYHAEEP
ncbi:MAG: hypothetical protein ACI9SP_001222 [Arenicella sp.]|jgi:hypothetical protein